MTILWIAVAFMAAFGLGALCGYDRGWRDRLQPGCAVAPDDDE
jgi:hypothetical protein